MDVNIIAEIKSGEWGARLIAESDESTINISLNKDQMVDLIADLQHYLETFEKLKAK